MLGMSLFCKAKVPQGSCWTCPDRMFRDAFSLEMERHEKNSRPQTSRLTINEREPIATYRYPLVLQFILPSQQYT